MTSITARRNARQSGDAAYGWALRNASTLAGCYNDADLEHDIDALELNDRAADIWKPLLAVTRTLGSAEAGEVLTSLAIEMGRDPDAAERDRRRAIAQSLRRRVNGNGAAAVGMTSDVVQHLRNDALEITENELHDLPACLLEDDDHVSFLVSGFDVPVSLGNLG